MRDKPKIEIQVDEVKDVWVAWSNTDCTEGRGWDFPLFVSVSQETSERLGSKGYVMGTPCPVKKAQAFRIDGTWFAPARIYPESKDDAAKREARQRCEAALARAKAAGLSDEDIALLAKR